MGRDVVYGGIYRHFKDKLYQVKCVAYHSESKEKMVVYQALYGDFKVYVRPFDMFVSKVDKVKYPDVEQEYRFELVDPETLPMSCIPKSVKAVVADKTVVTDESVAVDESAKTEAIKEEADNTEVAAKSVSDESEKPAEVKKEQSIESIRHEKLMDFLDADTYKERLNLLVYMKDFVTDDMLDTMAMSLDTVVSGDTMDERYRSLRNYIQTQTKFETDRFR